jgi:ribosome biogenesis protein UTP30
MSGASLVLHQIIGFRHLRKNYKTFEAKRKLAQSYSMFLADDSIIPMLSKYLGKEFFSRKKCVALPSSFFLRLCAMTVF